MIIDAKDLIIGRMATFVAKQALLGEEVIIVNSESAIITGTKEQVFAKYKQKHDRGTFKGPFVPRRPDMFLKRVIRGMIPYKTSKGEDAYKRIKCFVGMPSKVQDQKIEQVKGAHVSKVDNLKYTSVKEICRHLGGKI